jgi:hypothetical protein
VSTTTEQVDIADIWFDLRSGKKRLEDFADEVVDRATELSDLSRIELQEFFDNGVRLEKSSPRAGSNAPEFRLESLDQRGKRTGKLVQLSQQLEKPVALVFGSYT